MLTVYMNDGDSIQEECSIDKVDEHLKYVGSTCRFYNNSKVIGFTYEQL